jgi:hypothetical protein
MSPSITRPAGERTDSALVVTWIPRGDDLHRRAATLGDGLALHESEDGSMVIHALSDGRAHLIGSFADAVAALRALDKLNFPA